MDLKQIKLIIDLMKRSELTEFSVEEEGFKLKICRGPNGQPMVSNGRSSQNPFPAGLEAGLAAGQSTPPFPLVQAAPPPASPPAEEAGISYVKSPMVGTFYRSPSPESKSFVDIGSKISETSVVCIVEAMKIMNEIQAETKGTVVEVLIENGQPVEYGQKLFKVKQN